MTKQEKNNIEQYIIIKTTLSLIFNIEYIKKMDISDDLIFLENFEFRIKQLCSEGSITQEYRQCLYDFLIELRGIYDKDRNRRIEIINEIIEDLNNEIPDENLNFYREQLYRRQGYLKYLTSVYKNSDIDALKDHIHLSIGFDLVVLQALQSNTSDEEFIKEYLEDLANSPFYLESINCILYEYPEIFKDLTFYNRNMCVLNCLNKNIYKANKRMIKKMCRVIKKCS